MTENLGSSFHTEETAAAEETNSMFDQNFDDNTSGRDMSDDFKTEESFEIPADETNDPGKQTPPANPNAEKEEETEEDDEKLFDDDNDDETEDNLDIAKLNEKLGTNFKDTDELKKLLKKEDTVSEDQQDQQTLTRNSNAINVLTNNLKRTDEELVRMQFTYEFQSQKKDINSPEVKQEIEDKIEILKDSGLLENNARLLRNNIQSALNQKTAENEAINNKRQQKEDKQKADNRTSVQNHLAQVYKDGSFMGVEVTKEDITETYKDITTNKFFDEVNSDQRLIVEFALYKRFREKAQKNASGPTYSDGVKSVFDQISNKNTPRSLSQAKGGANIQEKDAVGAFIK